MGVWGLAHGALTDWRRCWPLVACLLAGEAVLGALIIRRVPYTEIDWIAYMQEVGGVVNGTLDYSLLRGDTGPLVYPGGFVGIFSGLYWLTDRGADIGLAQWVWLGFYLATLALVADIFSKARLCPPWALILLALSKRVHSIFVLRLFNDCVAMLFLYAAVALFLRQRWSLGSLLFSAAVSVKMNVLLFAPGLFVLLLMAVGPAGAATNIALCALLQLVVGAPFLVANPAAYIGRAFELSRVFTYKWTVNWKFLAEQTFVDKRLAVALLALHATALLVLAWRWSGVDGGPVTALRRWWGASTLRPRRLAPDFVAWALFTSNFAGIAFARTLHYQFYCWYFHSLPLLLWGAGLPAPVGAVLMLAVEVSFNVFPATPWSSALLQVCHAVLLIAVLLRKWPAGSADARVSRAAKEE